MEKIVMCSGDNCPMKESCYRYKATPLKDQMYLYEPPIKNGICEFFWGEQATSIWNQLKDIVGNKKNISEY